MIASSSPEQEFLENGVSTEITEISPCHMSPSNSSEHDYNESRTFPENRKRSEWVANMWIRTLSFKKDRQSHGPGTKDDRVCSRYLTFDFGR